MPLRPTRIWMPEMALTLVRRSSAQLPHAHYMLRTDPRWTKAEIREYLLKVYGVRCARIATYISAGTLKRVTGRRELYRTKTHKKVYIRVEGDIANPLVAEPPPPAAELR